MGPEERCRLGFEMIEAGRLITLNSLRLQMPDATDYEIHAALFCFLLHSQKA